MRGLAVSCLLTRDICLTEFFAVAVADKGLEAEEMMGAQMQGGSSVVNCGFL